MIEREHLDLEELNELLDSDESKSPYHLWTEGMSLKEAVALNVREVERRAIIDALALSGGNKAKAARLLKIDYTTLHSKIKLYRIQC
jgi:transcriptional regulator with GAF, ATPase, and Fis domain